MRVKVDVELDDLTWAIGNSYSVDDIFKFIIAIVVITDSFELVKRLAEYFQDEVGRNSPCS